MQDNAINCVRIIVIKAIFIKRINLHVQNMKNVVKGVIVFIPISSCHLFWLPDIQEEVYFIFFRQLFTYIPLIKIFQITKSFSFHVNAIDSRNVKLRVMSIIEKELLFENCFLQAGRIDEV